MPVDECVKNSGLLSPTRFSRHTQARLELPYTSIHTRTHIHPHTHMHIHKYAYTHTLTHPSINAPADAARARTTWPRPGTSPSPTPPPTKTGAGSLAKCGANGRSGPASGRSPQVARRCWPIQASRPGRGPSPLIDGDGGRYVSTCKSASVCIMHPSIRISTTCPCALPGGPRPRFPLLDPVHIYAHTYQAPRKNPPPCRPPARPRPAPVGSRRGPSGSTGAAAAWLATTLK